MADRSQFHYSHVEYQRGVHLEANRRQRIGMRRRRQLKRMNNRRGPRLAVPPQAMPMGTRLRPVDIVRHLFGRDATIQSTDPSAKGSFSQTFIVRGSLDIAREQLQWYPGYVPGSSAANRTGQYLVKLANLQDGWREAQNYVHLHRAKPVAVPCLPGEPPLLASAVIPKFYGAGVVSARSYVLITEFITGQSMGKLNPDSKTFRTFERALMSLWSAGVVHADLHMGNIIVTPSKQVKIIDFGFAVILPSGLRQRLVSRLCDPDSALNDQDIHDFVKLQQLHRKRNLMHINTNALRRLAANMRGSRGSSRVVSTPPISPMTPQQRSELQKKFAWAQGSPGSPMLSPFG